MLPNVPVDFLTIPFRKYVQGFLEIVDVFKASMDFRSTLELCPMWIDDVREDMPAMSLISKLAPGRPLLELRSPMSSSLGNL